VAIDRDGNHVGGAVTAAVGHVSGVDLPDQQDVRDAVPGELGRGLPGQLPRRTQVRDPLPGDATPILPDQAADHALARADRQFDRHVRGLLDEDEWDPAGEEAAGLRKVVAQVLHGASIDAGLRLVEALDAADDPDTAGLAASTRVAVMLARPTGANDQAGQPATGWDTSARPGPGTYGCRGRRRRTCTPGCPRASMLTHPTVAEAFQRAGADLVPLLPSLVCGIVATAGEGDADWLIQFDPDQTT
jgi:hypothetical protein